MGYHTTRKLVEQNKDTLEMIRTIVVERGEELRFDVPEGMYSNGQFWFWQLFASAQRFKDMYGGRYVDIKDQVKTKFDTRAEQVVIIPASPGYKSIPTLERKNDKKILEELKEYGGDIFSGFFYTPQDFNPEEFKERAKALDFEVIILDIRDDGQVQVTAQRIEKPSIAASLGFSTQRRPPRSPSDESLEEIMEELKRAKGER